jgi:hypothetical protein
VRHRRQPSSIGKPPEDYPSRSTETVSPARLCFEVHFLVCAFPILGVTLIRLTHI